MVKVNLTFKSDMRIPFITLLISALLITGTGCKKDKACLFSFVISNNYTKTDMNGNVIGTPNPDDWTYDSHFSACENSLFDFADTFSYQGLTAATVTGVGAFPNPFYDQLSFSSQYNGTVVEKVVIVDDQMDIIKRITFADHQNIGLYLPGLHPKRHYRLYYRFYGNNKTVIYQGYGDLRTTD